MMEKKTIMTNWRYWILKKELDRIEQIQKGGPMPVFYPAVNKEK
jgi:hypothetical protein